ncbi:MAG TPA: tetratricopeptide repeat protein [Thermoanaerobaculia bacterium]|jgi:tetratricopeptide (TPR) repeat protein|nr:tetratricopeptide repeat protein [Thermoanaerobaculia bacterium]
MLSRRNHTALLAVVLLLLSSARLFAQEWKGIGRLQGIVTDESGQPIEGAKVTLRAGDQTPKPEAAGPPTIMTDKHGKWSMLGLTGGTWAVLIEKDGYITSEGRLKVAESGPPQQAVTIKLKAIPKEQAQAQAAPKEPTKESKANEAINAGNAALQADKYADARASYEQALALLDPAKPEHAPVYVAVLRAIASTHYREAGQAKSKDAKAAAMDRSVVTLKKALEIKPDDPETLQLLVNVLVDAGRETEAQTYLAKLPQGTKLDPERLINVGIKYYNTKQIDKALEEFNRVIADNPDLAEAYYYRGLVYLNKGKVPEAKADFQKLLALDPKNKFAKEAQDYLKNL